MHSSMDSRTPPRSQRQSSYFNDSSPPTRTESSAPGTPMSSRRHRGPHRDGFSEKKCKDVLVRQCSWIPRNYNFKDGVSQVYEVLREYLGDENLDLAIAQLNELIEVPSEWPHDEGASFQAWKHDYMLRHKDLENSHVPRLRNIIVAPVNPTERLKKWREEHQERATLSSSPSSQTPSNNSEIQTTTPDYRIGARARGGDWRLENALFVSSKAQGTQVLQCPSAQELHIQTWNESFGRGGKLVQERTIVLGQTGLETIHLPSTILPLRRKKSFADLRLIRSFANIPVIRRMQSITIVPDIFKSSSRPPISSRTSVQHSEQASRLKIAPYRTGRKYLDSFQGRFASEVKVYESNPAVKDLPDPDSDTGNSYYCNIPTWPLPFGTFVPSPRFARKHGLVPEEVPLPGTLAIRLVPTADEAAIEKSFQDGPNIRNPKNGRGLVGPFTPELFKDSGIDFPRYWEKTELTPFHGKCDTENFSDIGASGDAAQSPSKPIKSIRTSNKKSSPVLASPLPELLFLNRSPKKVSRHLTSVFVGQSIDVISKSKEIRRRQWKDFGLKCNGRPTNNVNQVTVVLYQAYLPLIESQTDLAGAFRQMVSTALFHNSIATLIPQSFQKILYPFNKLRSTLQYQVRNSAVTQIKICDIIKPVKPFTSSGIIASANYIPNSETAEAIKNNNLSVHADGDEGKLTEERGEHNKIWLHIKDTHFLGEALANFRVPARIEDHTEQEHIVELGQNILVQARYSYCSETMLDLGESKVKVLPCVIVNNNESGEALTQHYNTNFQTTITDSLRNSRYNSFTVFYIRQKLPEWMPDLLINSEMDLNRDLPPLPLLTERQTPQTDNFLHQQSLDVELEDSLELISPLYYDPVRDSLKYGGIHYHPDGMRYYPEIHQHPPRTSSMLPPNSLLHFAAVGSEHLQVKTGEPLVPLVEDHPPIDHGRGFTPEPHISYNSDTSSGIMGNFIPVETTATPSEISTSVVHVAWTEANSNTCSVDQNFNSNSSCETVPSQNLINSRGISEGTGDFMADKSRRAKLDQSRGGTFYPHDDHHSIDLNDPEALAKYIRHLKNLRKRAEVKKQSLGISSSLSQNVDGEGGKLARGHNADDCYTYVESNRGADIMAQDYSEIRAGNPFSFESETVPNDPKRLTTITDFMGEANRVSEISSPPQTRKKGHLKNSHSESNALYMKKRPEPIQINDIFNSIVALHRSDSTPSLSPTRIVASRSAAQVSLQPLHNEDYYPRSRTVDLNHRFKDSQMSPTRAPRFTKSVSKKLDDLPESHETASATPPTIPKRPWSPVKKMFGEGGWLSNTVNSKEEVNTPKRHGLVEKIKLKIEEMGLKADLSPQKNSIKNDREKSWEHSTFPISLNPARQAELYLDIELLICDSANTFLMHEYQNGRMSVDSLKRVTDFWKSKGRPQVVEFHYDQSTQRDLIVANQKTFRFYGPNANNPLQVHAMLYAWKTNAREMAVRTFCYPDSMIRKHIQDAFVMLDFLGGHPFQYIAAHEVQGKLVTWVQEAQMHTSAGFVRTPSAKKVGRYSNESFSQPIVGSPWHSAARPPQSPSKQSSWNEDN